MQTAMRLSGSVLIAATVAALAACAAVPSAEPAELTPSGTEDPAPDLPSLPDQLTFEAGADLDPEYWRAGWHVESPADMTNGYAVVYPRDDWQEVQFDGNGCEGTRSHRFGSLDDLDLSLDDRSLSDQFLAHRLETSVDDIAEEGSTVAFPVVGRRMWVDFRVRAGGWSDGGTFLEAVRVFGALDTALVIRLDCDPGPMTGASGQQMFDLLPEVVGLDAMNVGIARVDWNVVEALDFEDGANLVASSGAEWVDAPLMEDPSWAFGEGVGGEGTWRFTGADGDCTADFEQTRLDDSYRDMSGDRDATNEYLATLLDYPVHFVHQDGAEGTLGLGVPGNDLVSARLFEGAGIGERWVVVARAFTEPLLGFSIRVTCGNGDPREALDRVVASSAIQVVP